MEKHGVDTVVVQQAEDETAIIKRLQYVLQSDEIVGSCGPVGENHKYQDNYVLKVGEGPNAYDTVKQFLKNSVKGHMARCIMLNPMHLLTASPFCNIPWTNMQHVQY